MNYENTFEKQKLRDHKLSKVGIDVWSVDKASFRGKCERCQIRSSKYYCDWCLEDACRIAGVEL